MLAGFAGLAIGATQSELRAPHAEAWQLRSEPSATPIRTARLTGRRGPGRRVLGQDQREPRGLVEVEVCGEIADVWVGVADVGTWVGAPVGGRVQPLPAEEVV